LPKKDEENRSKLWRWIAKKVVSKPLAFFFPVLLFLLLLGYPILSAKFGISDYRITPKDSESRQFFNKYEQYFDIKDLTPIILLVQSPHTSILSLSNLNELRSLTKKLQENPAIKDIKGIVSSDSKLKGEDYHRLYTMPKKQMPEEVKKLL